MKLPKKQFVSFLLIVLSLTIISGCDFSQPLTTLPTNQPSSPSPLEPSSTHLTASTTNTPQPTNTIIASPTNIPPSPTPTPTPIKFAIIGDYGEGSEAERDVATLVKSWGVDFIITLGDNNYPYGSSETIDENIGKYYSNFIFPYLGKYGNGADKNRFFPTLGNHDWNAINAQPYIDYFELPGNERYYDFTWGPIHFFALDSDSNEPDGVSRISIQAQWLEQALSASNEEWNIVYMHHPPYTSGKRGPVEWMRWPFQKWGATIVFAGHDHYYERLSVEGFPYIINGLGGGPIYGFGEFSPYSQKRFNGDWGAILCIMQEDILNCQFITRTGEVIDTFKVTPVSSEGAAH